MPTTLSIPARRETPDFLSALSAAGLAQQVQRLRPYVWNGPMKRVVSLWLPRFPIERLMRAAPGSVPPDKPVALVESGAHGLAIIAVNAAGAREGVRVGTALADARAALPSLISRAAEPGKDRIALLRMARWTGRYGPNRHVDGSDGLWIDITGVAHLFGGEEALLDDVTRRFASFGLTVRAGLADTLGAAHALARFGVEGRERWALAPDALTRDALAPLPVEALRLDAPRVLLLKRLGLRRIGQLYDIPRDSLARRFRSKDAAGAVLIRLDCALGTVAEPRRPMSTPAVLSVSRTFSEPLISAEPLEAITGDLCLELATALAAKDLGAKAIRLALYRADGTVAEVETAMSTPCREGPHMMALLREKLANVDAGFGIDLLRLDAVRVERHGAHQNGFAQDGAREGIGPLVDRLSNRFGAAAVTVIQPRSRHIPERAEIRVPALNAPRPSYAPPWPYREEPYRMGLRRPPFLLTRPEPISVMAGVPDGPPARFTWRRVERRVIRAEGPERIAPEWWRTLHFTGDQKRPRSRDYYAIEDEQGAAYWVFRHGLYGAGEDDDDEDLPRWFLQGMFA